MNKHIFKCLLKRDKRFNLFFIAALVVEILVFIATSIDSAYIDNSTRYTFYFDIQALCYNYLPVALFSVIILQIIRSSLYENNTYRDALSALPITKKDRITYDIIIGFVGMGITMLIESIITIISGYYTYFEYYDTLTLIMTNEILICIVFSLEILIAYVIFIIAKSISKNPFWSVLFTAIIYGILLCIGQILLDHNKLPQPGLDDEYVYYLIPILILLIILALTIVSAYLISNKVDESKGGAYRFKTINIIVSLAVAGVMWLVLHGFVEYDSDNIFMEIIFKVVSFILTIATFAGMYYVTAPKK